jgi:hypothetical protein
MKILYNDISSPVCCVKNIDQKTVSEVGDIGRTNLWSFNVKLLWASYLPKQNAKYGFQIAVQDSSETFETKLYGVDKICWNTCKSFALHTLTNKKEELPDLFLYLTNEKGEVVSFQRLKLSTYYLKEDTYLIKLLPEPCNNKVTNVCYSGVVKIRMKLFNRALNSGPECDLSLFKDGDEDKTDLLAISSALMGGDNNIGEDDDLENILHGSSQNNNDIQFNLP